MTHSQGPEEALIRRYFKGRKARFLDIGANDGKTLSNTYACMLRGWSGVMVEPSPKAFERLQATCATFPAVQLLNYAIASEAGTVTLHESGPHLGNEDVALLSSLDVRETVKWTRETFTPVEVEAITFAGLMHRTEGPFQLVSIDAEGMDFEILKQMDLDALGVEVLIVEHEHIGWEAVVDYIRPFGLLLNTRTFQNLIFFR